ncbi:hypothetical protein ACFQUU_00070 [Herbaspirillum sp. GCM10030257]|uniref:hypothetical protein n=1 Tax=Herbaspirillum sp. GCM10030257 TaxID=3273393 RepID=UPI00360DB69F
MSNQGMWRVLERLRAARIAGRGMLQSPIFYQSAIDGFKIGRYQGMPPMVTAFSMAQFFAYW